ncbi:MAG: STAS domain-containing protein [Deltaproteobacteria bacterium]|nr:STAS domain-containing protein [Deltaproteobacteria bacterium]
MEMVITEASAGAVFSITGRMDALSAPEVEAKLNPWLEQKQRVLILDLEGLDYISSAGLRVLLFAAKRMKARGGVLFLARLQAGVKQVFEISGFSAILPIYDTVEAALEAAK